MSETKQTIEGSEAELYRLMVENLRDYAVFVVDLQGRVERWNTGAERLLGYREDEILGQSIKRFFIPEDVYAGVPEREMREALESGGGNNDRWHVRKDGTRFWAGGMMTALRDEHRKVCGFAKILRDRTEWKRAQEASENTHRQQQEWLRVTLASIGDAVIATDTEGRVKFINPVATALTGWTESEAQGQLIDSVFVIRNERTREPVRNPVHKVLEEGAVVGLENHTILIARDGKERPIDDSGAPIRDSTGCVLGAVLVFRDVTEQRRAEQELRENEARKSAILETALDCIITMNARGEVIEFNPAAERTFGYRRADVLGRELAELIIPPSLRKRHHEGMAHYLATGEGPVLGKRIELPAMHATGREFRVELAITRISADGPPVFTAYLRDIGERVRREQLRNVRHTVTQQLSQAAGIEEGGREVLRAICESLAWDVGFFWGVDEYAGVLVHLAGWQRAEIAATAFVEATRSRTFRPGEGLPGRVWSSGRPAWIPEVAQDTNFPRAEPAARSGVHSGFACPIVSGDETLGVIEFFTHEIRQPDEELLETMATVTGQLAQFIQRRRAEATLRDTEGRFRALMEQAPFSIQMLAPDGRTLQVNRAWCDLWSATLEDLAGYNMLQDAQLENKGVLPHLKRAFAGEAVALPAIAYDPRDALPDRSWPADPVRWVSAVAYPLKDSTGRVQQIVLVHHDITERRRAEAALRDSEEKLRLLADSIPQLAWMARSDGHVFWYNRRWYEYTGTTPEEMQGWGWQSVHDPDVLPNVMKRWKGSIASGEPFEMVFPLRGADQQFRPFLTRVNPLRDEDGRVLYWCGTNTDISGIKRMEEALRDADRRKDEFLATLAHELRNPLAPIRNSLQILKMPRIDAGVAQQTRDVMERQVHHLVRLVDDLLDVSRVIRGKIELRREPIELATVVARAVETAQPLIEVQAHELEIALPDESLRVHADPVRLAQVISNLLTNAAKYTNAHGHIRLSAMRDAGYAVVSVKDDGIGIAPDVLPHVFELFVQGDPTASRSQGGLGIGLTLAKNLVQLHEGTVEAYSEGLGKGSTFTIRLPLLNRTSEQAPEPVEAQGALQSSGHRLMVVDDNRDAADSLAWLLRLHGHDVVVCYDGASALARAREYRPALIFLDLGMPEIDGYEAARLIRRAPGLERTQLVALTGWGQKEDRRRSAQAGFDHHLVKPADAKDLQELLSGLSRET